MQTQSVTFTEEKKVSPLLPTMKSRLPIECSIACRGQKRLRISRSKYSPVAEDRKHQQQ